MFCEMFSLTILVDKTLSRLESLVKKLENFCDPWPALALWPVPVRLYQSTQAAAAAAVCRYGRQPQQITVNPSCRPDPVGARIFFRLFDLLACCCCSGPSRARLAEQLAPVSNIEMLVWNMICCFGHKEWECREFNFEIYAFTCMQLVNTSQPGTTVVEWNHAYFCPGLSHKTVLACSWCFLIKDHISGENKLQWRPSDR